MRVVTNELVSNRLMGKFKSFQLEYYSFVCSVIRLFHLSSCPCGWVIFPFVWSQLLLVILLYANLGFRSLTPFHFALLLALRIFSHCIIDLNWWGIFLTSRFLILIVRNAKLVASLNLKIKFLWSPIFSRSLSCSLPDFHTLRNSEVGKRTEWSILRISMELLELFSQVFRELNIPTRSKF